MSNLILRDASNRQLTRTLCIYSSDYLPSPWKTQSVSSLVLAWLEFPVPAHKTMKRKCKFSKDAHIMIVFMNIYSMRKSSFTGLVTHFSQRPRVPAPHNEFTKKLHPGGIFYSLFRSVTVVKIPLKTRFTEVIADVWTSNTLPTH